MWIALVPMLAWGSIGLVSGKMGGDAHQQTLGMTFGALIFAIVTTIFSFQHFLQYNSFKLWTVGIVSGLCWCLGQNNQFKAMKAIGVSKAVPISTGAQLVTTTIAGAVFSMNGRRQDSSDSVFWRFCSWFRASYSRLCATRAKLTMTESKKIERKGQRP